MDDTSALAPVGDGDRDRDSREAAKILRQRAAMTRCTAPSLLTSFSPCLDRGDSSPKKAW